MSTSSNPVLQKNPSLVAYVNISEPRIRGGNIKNVPCENLIISAGTIAALQDDLYHRIRKALVSPGMIAAIEMLAADNYILWMKDRDMIVPPGHKEASDLLLSLKATFSVGDPDLSVCENGSTIERLGCIDVWENQPTVVVAMVTTKNGLLMVRRGLRDGYGKLALPGGFQVVGETWQQAAAKELLEETGLVINPDLLIERKVETVGPNKDINLLFCEYPVVVDDFEINFDHEILEVLTVKEPVETAFPTHTAQVKAYFDRLQEQQFKA